ncbi:competence/damage-inducible protein A [Alkalihalobacillus pseudalcaliphilus]|uniref:competence/damage-inducible protein A n=1 Tax=Alkalihalobacillus pseudalcaliphilus TaxID=79884 RepID=UPI00064DB820|nr:competence/damage-inducible protein A [Alkalihalobacillus pseudalcaliphilus]KMK77283.1 damage-inducible protein CinA [Alkalihalobacillus pseudalcaliphilus]
MKAEIIAVGSELLLGQITNTNAQFISKQLAELGIDVYFQTVVGDNQTRLLECLNISQKRSDLIILTGGLGPTKDDLTKETVASMYQTTLVSDEVALQSIVAFFKNRNIEMTENNKKQALVLRGSTVLANHFGMAPGMYFQQGSKAVVLLPGPPKEMEPMFINELVPLLEQQLPQREKISSRVLRFFGIGESILETKLERLLDAQSNPTIAPLASDGEVTLRLTVKEANDLKAQVLLDETEQAIMDIVGEFFYGYDQITIMDVLFRQLKQDKLTIAAAESLTGGLFSYEMTNFSGASSVFVGSTVAYSSKVKEKQLNVSKEVIEQFGVVSPDCAKQMAVAAKELYNSDIAISFTGVAGPTKQENKDVGTVYIGIVGKEAEPMAYPIVLQGSRQAIRVRTVKYGCYYLLKEMKRWKILNDKL